MSQNKTIRKRILNHLGHVGVAAVTLILMTPPSLAVDPTEATNQVMGTEGGKKAAKEALDAAVKMAKSKPAMSAATSIVCLACVPAAGVVASPGMCIACGILIAKTIGQFIAKFSFDSEGLVVDWVSFNLKSLVDSKVIAIIRVPKSD